MPCPSCSAGLRVSSNRHLAHCFVRAPNITTPTCNGEERGSICTFYPNLSQFESRFFMMCAFRWEADWYTKQSSLLPLVTVWRYRGFLSIPPSPLRSTHREEGNPGRGSKSPTSGTSQIPTFLQTGSGLWVRDLHSIY